MQGDFNSELSKCYEEKTGLCLSNNSYSKRHLNDLWKVYPLKFAACCKLSSSFRKWGSTRLCHSCHQPQHVDFITVAGDRLMLVTQMFSWPASKWMYHSVLSMGQTLATYVHSNCEGQGKPSSSWVFTRQQLDVNRWPHLDPRLRWVLCTEAIFNQ